MTLGAEAPLSQLHHTECVLAPCALYPQLQGSGLSEGQWVTLGAEEVNDVECAVAALRASGRVSTLGVWGRSMGAVTALLYSQRDPTIAGMVGVGAMGRTAVGPWDHVPHGAGCWWLVTSG